MLDIFCVVTCMFVLCANMKRLCVCVCVCVFLCLFFVQVHVCVCVCVCVHTYVHTHTRLRFCNVNPDELRALGMYVFMHVSLYVRQCI